jgi:hypothetical protein
MSGDFQRVEPAPFEAPAPQTPAPASEAASGQSPWLWPALTALVLLAAAVVFLLPRWVDSGAGAPATQAPSAAPGNGDMARTGTARPATATTDNRGAAGAAPFADAAAARARSAAQEVLAELLDVQEQLRARGAEEWAADEMAAVNATASEGDEQYRERAFDAALARYEAALAMGLALEQSIPGRFDTALENAVAAIEALEPDGARAYLEQAGQLQPDDPGLPGVRQRIDVLPTVVEAVSAARAAAGAGDLAAAVEQLAAAAAQDPSHRAVAAELATTRSALTEQRFSTAMSDGYAALDADDFERAIARFTAAGKLRPGSAEAAAALAEVEVARTAATLRRLRERGRRQLAEEDWPAAITTFEEALAVDASLRFAREGIAFARPRAAISAALQAIVDEPGRLVDDALLREAGQTLASARALDDPGPRLSALIERSAKTLAVAATPVDVNLRSDGETTVTVYKVARLGSFTETTLSLRPGAYTAVGARRGFRDVRVEFTVTPGGLATPVYISCSEAI